MRLRHSGTERTGAAKTRATEPAAATTSATTMCSATAAAATGTAAAAATTTTLTGENIVYFGPEPWEGLWRNRHQLLTRFAQMNAVMYVEPRIDVRSLVRGVRSGQIRWRHLFHPLVSRANGVWIFHSPKWLPASGKPIVADLLTWAWARLLGRSLGARRMASPIVWVSRPDMSAQLRMRGAKLGIYHVVDEYSEYYGMTSQRKALLRSRERQLLDAADLTIVVSETLYCDKAARSKSVHLVPNAVDYPAFRTAAGVPLDMTNLTRPIIGYSGLISERLDLRLLIELADRNPDWSFVLVGRRDPALRNEDMRALERRHNVHFLGIKSVGEVPCYVRSFDVGTIPYKTDRNADSCSPLKLYEYMAAGIPVVATDFAVARQFAGVVRVAADARDFEAKLGGALGVPRGAETAERVRRGVSIAAANTWERRIETLSAIILGKLGAAARTIE